MAEMDAKAASNSVARGLRVVLQNTNMSKATMGANSQSVKDISAIVKDVSVSVKEIHDFNDSLLAAVNQISSCMKAVNDNQQGLHEHVKALRREITSKDLS